MSVVNFPYEQVYTKRGGAGLGFNPILNTLSDAELRSYYQDAISTLWDWEAYRQLSRDEQLIDPPTPEDVQLAKKLLRDIPKSLISRGREFYIDEFSELHIKPIKCDY